MTVDGQQQPIEADPTAALAYELNDSPLYAMEIASFLRGGIFSGLVPKDRAQDGLFTLHPYRPGEIPVVLVHGKASSPARWAELINELEAIPVSAGSFRSGSFFTTPDTWSRIQPDG